MTDPSAAAVVLRLPEAFADCAGCARVKGVVATSTGTSGESAWVVESLATRCREHLSSRLTVTHPDGTSVEITVAYETSTPYHSGIHAVAQAAAAIAQVVGGEEVVRDPVMAATVAAAALVRAGMPATEETWRWAYAGWDTADLIEDSRRVGLDPESARRWIEGLREERATRLPEVTAEQTLAWWVAAHAECLTMWECHEWTRLGVNHPRERPATLSARDLETLLSAQVDDRDAGWAGVAAVCPRLVWHGRSRAVAPAAIVALFSAMADPARRWDWCGCNHWGSACGWDGPAVQDALDVARDLDGSQAWLDAATCLRAGMSSVEAVEHVTAGRDMDGVRLLGALVR